MQVQKHSIKYLKEQFTDNGRMIRIIKAFMYIIYFVFMGTYMVKRKSSYIPTAIYIFTAIAGLFIGSFLNLCIDRIPKEEDIILKPSHCRNCNHRLDILDLIPVISYILLGGRCRYCKKKYHTLELGEVVVASILTVLLHKYNFTFRFMQLSILICFLYVISIIDYQILGIYFPNIKTGFKLAFIPFIIVLIYQRISGQQIINCNIIYELTGNPLFNFTSTSNLGFGLLVGLGFMGFLYFITFKKAIGEGDIYITGIIGLSIGHDYLLVAIVMSCVIATIVGLIGVLIYIGAKVFKVNMKVPYKESRFRKMPYIPFLSLGTIVSIFYAPQLINIFLNF